MAASVSKPSWQPLFVFDRKIDALYGELPWPEQIAAVLIHTPVIDGSGDISAAAKVIKLIQTLFPKIVVHWQLFPTGSERAHTFLECAEGVTIHKDRFSFNESVQFVVTGPVPCSYPITGAGHLGFIENGAAIGTQFMTESIFMLYRNKEKTPGFRRALFSEIFKHYIHGQTKQQSHLAMGLEEGTGIFLDPERFNTPLSKAYCCPSFLEKIQESALREDILMAMGGRIDYTTHSFNSGYANGLSKKLLYIELLAMHERKRNVVVVLNQTHLDAPWTSEQFCNEIATSQRLDLFKAQGFLTVVVKGNEGVSHFLLNEGGRTFTLVLRHRISPEDMKSIQFASERMLTTGDNSSAEAFAARCMLYVYEVCPHKLSYLAQQISLAQSVSPNVANLLKLFAEGGNIKKSSFNEYSPKQISALQEILRSDRLGEETLEFCHTVITKHQFEPILKNALLRSVWQSVLPDLAEIERTALSEDEEFLSALADSDKLSFRAPLPDSALIPLKHRIIKKIDEIR